MKHVLLSILCGFAVSSTPVIAQVAPAPRDKQTYKQTSDSKLHEHKGDSYLNLKNWKSAADEYSTCINLEKEKKECGKIADRVKPPEHPQASTPIPVTAFRNCFNSPPNRPIVRSALALLPNPVMESLHDHGVKIVVAPSVPDYYLSIETNTKSVNLPRPSEGKSLDNVEGQYLRDTKIVVIGENGLDAHDTSKDKIRLVLHELGHAYDHSIHSVSGTLPFKLFYAQDLDAMPISVRSKNQFYQEANRLGCGQVFADIFTTHCIDPLCLDPQSKDLAQKFPRTYKYMKEILPARQTMK